MSDNPCRWRPLSIERSTTSYFVIFVDPISEADFDKTPMVVGTIMSFSTLKPTMKPETTINEQIHYTPPKSDAKGISIASSILFLFILCWYHALFRIDFNTASWFNILTTFIAFEFLYTGLFITCHDAMHGVISPRHRWINNFLGRACITIYAWFDYNCMYKKHWQHHHHTGVVHKDPDYHDGQSINFFRWYFRFLFEYVSIKQMTKMFIYVSVLQYILYVSLTNILVYLLVAGLLSSLRLFYFGTYIPHRPKVIDGQFEKTMPWEKSNSSNANRLLSFLCCYHFDYHWEHHRWPFAPWWELWKCKEIRQQLDQEKKISS